MSFSDRVETVKKKLSSLENKEKLVGVKMSNDLYKKIEDLANETEKTNSCIVREILEWFFKK